MSNDPFANAQALTQQVLSATNSLSDAEAAQRYQQILAQLPPDQAAELNALALSQVRAVDRRQLAAQFRQAHQDPGSPFDGYDDTDDDDTAASPRRLGLMAARAQQQDPRLLGNLFGEDSPLRGPIGRAALAALAALLIRRLQSSQGGQGQGLPAGGADPIGTILDSLLGAGGQTAPAPRQPAPGGDLGDLLGSLLGGGAAGGLGAQTAPAPRQPTPAPRQPAPGGLGDLLGGLLGGGAGAQHLPAGGDLGSILSSILRGGDATPDENAVGGHRKEGLHVGGKREAGG